MFLLVVETKFNGALYGTCEDKDSIFDGCVIEYIDSDNACAAECVHLDGCVYVSFISVRMGDLVIIDLKIILNNYQELYVAWVARFQSISSNWISGIF